MKLAEQPSSATNRRIDTSDHGPNVDRKTSLSATQVLRGKPHQDISLFVVIERQLQVGTETHAGKAWSTRIECGVASRSTHSTVRTLCLCTYVQVGLHTVLHYLVAMRASEPCCPLVACKYSVQSCTALHGSLIQTHGLQRRRKPRCRIAMSRRVKLPTSCACLLFVEVVLG